MYNTVPPDRTSPTSPSEPSLSSCLSFTSSRESSPDIDQFSAATSSPDIGIVCGTPFLKRQDHLSLVMENHNRLFNLPNSRGNRNNHDEELTDTSSSFRSPTLYDNGLVPPVSFPANNRNSVFRGNSSAGLFTDRNLTSANWRNTNFATSQNGRAYIYNSNELMNAATQFPASYHTSYRQSADTTRNMSSPSATHVEKAPAEAGAPQESSSNDPGVSSNASCVGHSSDGTFALTEGSRDLTTTTNQQQQVGRRSGQTDMPYYAYCFDRGNGQYTRLIPADMLPPLVDIPALQQGCVGMTTLPCPTGLAPNGRSSNLERVFVQPVQQFPSGQVRGGNSRDAVQSRIDTIIASSPAPEAQKRQKIYCDKWIHEGVCAFTQQGCKYKHEMPLDKDTQESLGLFQGLPIWWRKHQGEISADQHATHVMDSPPPAPVGRPRGFSNTSRGGGYGGSNRLRQHTWRSQAQPVAGRRPSTSVSSGSGVMGGGQGRQQQVAQFSSPFGPIGPPRTSTRPEFDAVPRTAQGIRNQPLDNNFWNVLRSEPGSDESEEPAKLG